MKYLKYFMLFCSVLPVSLPVETRPANNHYHIQTAAKAFNLEPELLLAICRVESRCKATKVNHNDGTRAQRDLGVISKSYGLFQIKKGTAKGLGWTSKEDLLDPAVNAYYAAKLIRYQINRYAEIKSTISAYNAGKAIKANKAYVDKVLIAYAEFKLNKLP